MNNNQNNLQDLLLKRSKYRTAQIRSLHVCLQYICVHVYVRTHQAYTFVNARTVSGRIYKKRFPSSLGRRDGVRNGEGTYFSLYVFLL